MAKKYTNTHWEMITLKQKIDKSIIKRRETDVVKDFNDFMCFNDS